MSPFMEINGKRIGPGYPTYIVAELSANHQQDFDQAVRLIEQAHQAGADAVKLQTYTADTMTLDCPQPCFQIGAGTIWQGRRLYDLYREAYTPWEWQPRLKAIAEELGLALFSSPFDPSAVDFLEQMAVPAYKVASFELVDLPLIEYICRTGKPIILSTGMASLAEIEEAVNLIRTAGNPLTLLKCTSAYPAAAAEMNLRTITHLAQTFQVPVGLSDHTLSSAVAVAAVALGACLVEKHFTLDRQAGGPDSAFSLQPEEFQEMVTAIRTVEQALGTVCYTPGQREKASRAFRRSLFAVRDIAADEVLTPENVRAIRPADGLAPKYLPQVLGKRAVTAIARGTPIDWNLLKGSGQVPSAKTES